MGAWLVKTFSFYNLTLQNWMVIAIFIALVAVMFAWRMKQ
ncbi:hypothetical protein V1280_000061 [Bradyrhizobium sp. AZCC 2230]